jgi:hypothetical protein
MSDPNKRRLWWVWTIWGAAFLIIEGIALFTKEKALPSLTRTLWWLKDYQVKVKWRGEVVFTFKPFRVAFVIFVIWFPIHILGGECALGVC